MFFDKVSAIVTFTFKWMLSQDSEKDTKDEALTLLQM